MTEYRHITVDRCVRCQNPWAGWGLVCNECRQIEALEIVAKSNNYSSSSSYSGNSGADVSNGFLLFVIGLIGLFFYGNYLLDWIPLKIIWFFVTGVISIIGLFF